MDLAEMGRSKPTSLTAVVTPLGADANLDGLPFVQHLNGRGDLSGAEPNRGPLLRQPHDDAHSLPGQIFWWGRFWSVVSTTSWPSRSARL